MIALILIGLAFIVMATSEGMRIISPSSGSNYSSASGILFSVSYINETDITSPSNATFYLNNFLPQDFLKQAYYNLNA